MISQFYHKMHRKSIESEKLIEGAETWRDRRSHSRTELSTAEVYSLQSGGGGRSRYQTSEFLNTSEFPTELPTHSPERLGEGRCRANLARNPSNLNPEL